MKRQHVCLDMISTLPQNVIETILCLLPIQEAARTSILSRKWRYNWVKIPKLVFIDSEFKVISDADQQSIVEETFLSLSERKDMSKRCRVFYAIYQILFAHRGPIDEFSLIMDADDSCVEIDQILRYLSRNYNVKILTIDVVDYDSDFRYRLPLSIFSLHQLSELTLTNCLLDHHPTKFTGFGSLTSIFMDGVSTTTQTLLHLLSNSPLLKSLTLILFDTHLYHRDSTIFDLFKCIPVIETLNIFHPLIECFAHDAVPRELPISFVHLKFFCLQAMNFCDKYGLPFLVLVIRCSPNLKKLNLELEQYLPPGEKFVMHDYSDICLEHLNVLKIENFDNLKPEMEFVKLILAKAPVLKKVSIVLCNEVDKDEELKMFRNLLCSPRASPVVNIFVNRPGGGNRC